MANAILRLPAVQLRTGLARSTIYDHIRDGRFPGPIHLGPRSVGWLENEIETWLAARIENRDKGQEVAI